MARVKFYDKYISTELEKISRVLTMPIDIYLIGGGAMIEYGLKAATKDIDVILSTNVEAIELILALKRSGYQQIQTSRLALEYKEMSATQILENADGFRWDIFQEFVCKKLRLSNGMIKRAKPHITRRSLTVWLVSREDIFLLKSVTQRDDDEEDMLILARSKLDWDTVLQECIDQSRHDLICEIDLYDKLDRLKTTHGLKTPIYNYISKVSQEQMEKWFEDMIIKELVVKSMTLNELIEVFRSEKEILLPSLMALEKTNKIKKIKDRYVIKK
ncbi:MAG: hypothetical protein K8R25_16145 [Methanosarcinales archaeon]|nr:hypothetical protein [Methanosarcinales archaeon]